VEEEVLEHVEVVIKDMQEEVEEQEDFEHLPLFQFVEQQHIQLQ
jgi:hypothetical protein